MLTSNQRDILAGVMTAIRHLDGGDRMTIKQWIEVYEFYREKINESIEEKQNESNISD